MNKYHNKKTVINGITFDSQKECNRFLELSILQKAGEISGLERQKKFEVVPKSDGDKPVLQFDKCDNFITEFKSASEASRMTSINRGNICTVANHRVIGNTHYLSAGGYKWEWK